MPHSPEQVGVPQAAAPGFVFLGWKGALEANTNTVFVVFVHEGLLLKFPLHVPGLS